MKEFFQKVKVYVQDPSNANFVYTSIALIVTGVFAIAIFYFASRTSNDPEPITSEEQQRVLSEIIRNNPKSIFPELNESDSSIDDDSDNTQVDGANRPATDTVEDKTTGKNVTIDTSNPSNTSPIPAPKIGVNGEYVGLSQDDIIVPDLSLYNYRETVTSTTHGPGFEICDVIFEGGCGGYYISPSYKPHSGETIISTDYAFYDRSHSYYRSDIEVDGTNARTDIGLYGTDINVNYQSAFGEVYLRNIAEPYEWYSNSESWLLANSYSETSPDSYPDSYTLPESKIESQFGPNVSIVEPYEEEGREIYEVTISYFVTCNDERRPIFSVYKVAGDTFEILSRSEYIDEISDNTLRFTQVVESIRRTVSLDEVQEIFSDDDLPGEAVTVDRTNYTYNEDTRSEQIIQHIASSNLDVLSINEGDMIDNVWGARFPGYLENENLYMERRYYAENMIGQAMYDQLNEYLDKSPQISISWRDASTNEYYSTRLYKNNVLILDELVPNEVSTDWYFSTSTPLTVSLRVFGAEIFEGEAYKYDSYYYSNYPSSYPISYALSYSTSYPSSYNNSGYNWLQTYGSDYYFEIGEYYGSVSVDTNYPLQEKTIDLISGTNASIVEKIRAAY